MVFVDRACAVMVRARNVILAAIVMVATGKTNFSGMTRSVLIKNNQTITEKGTDKEAP